MDPIALAALTSAVTVLAQEVLKGTASEIGKDIWGSVKSLLGFSADPPESKLAIQVAQKLAADQQIASKVANLLQQNPTGVASTLVGSLNADKVIIIKDQHVDGDFKIEM